VNPEGVPKQRNQQILSFTRQLSPFMAYLVCFVQNTVVTKLLYTLEKETK
jgi:hypothetical protein